MELFVTDGGQRDIIGNIALPQLRHEVRQKLVSGSINEKEMQGDVWGRVFAYTT